MSWEVWPEPRTAAERLALLTAADQAVKADQESAWWRSGLEDLEPLNDGLAPNEMWRGAGVTEP
ncbi:MAG TPA: hypothetical protein VGU26_04780 [Gaiellaceae bacterium]|nr:hypothetical protein [Gaiellaceae bacterium]